MLLFADDTACIQRRFQKIVCFQYGHWACGDGRGRAVDHRRMPNVHTAAVGQGSIPSQLNFSAHRESTLPKTTMVVTMFLGMVQTWLTMVSHVVKPWLTIIDRMVKPW